MTLGLESGVPRLCGTMVEPVPGKKAPFDRTHRSNSFDAGGAVLHALARSPHYNENLHRQGDMEPVPGLNLDAGSGGSMYEFFVHKWEIPRKLFHCVTGFVVLNLYRLNVDVHLIVKVLFYIFLVVASADLLRLNSPSFERLYETVLGVLMREGEKERVNGVVWYLVGVMMSLHFFPEDISSVSIIILSWCDPAASTFGRLLGKHTPSLPSRIFARRKSLAGFVAAWIVGTFIAYLFWGTGIAKRSERASGVSWMPGGYATFGTPLMPDSFRTGWHGFAHGLAASDPGFSERLRTMTQTRAPAIPPIVMYLSCGLLAAFTEALEIGGMDDNVAIPILSGFLIWFMLWLWGWLVTSL